MRTPKRAPKPMPKRTAKVRLGKLKRERNKRNAIAKASRKGNRP